MSTTDLVRVRLTQYGDRLYLTIQVGSGEELVLTGSESYTLSLRLVPKSQVKDPRIALFMVLNEYGEISETEEDSGKRPEVKPGDSVQLKHIHRQQFVSWKDEDGIPQMTLSEDIDISLSFSMLGERKCGKKHLRDGDSVPIVGKSTDAFLAVDRNFRFNGATKDKWIVRKYEEYIGDSSNVRFGQVFFLRANNGMFLSVRPNISHSDTLILSEEQQSADCLEDAEAITLPEYMGPLRADLNTDSEDANNAWVLEREDPFVGGTIKSKETFYMRHIASGRYLAADLTLVSRSGAKPFTFTSVDGDEVISLSELLEFRNVENEVISVNYSVADEYLTARLFQRIISKLPRDSRIRQSLKVQSEKITDNPLSLEAIHVNDDDATLLVTLAMYHHPLAVWRTALQNIKQLENATQVVDGIKELINTSYFLFYDTTYTRRADFASDMQIFFEFVRIYLLQEKYPNEFTNEELKNKVSNIWLFFEDFERAFSSLFARKGFLSACFEAMLLEISNQIGFGLQSYVPEESVRLFWCEFGITCAIRNQITPEYHQFWRYAERLLDRIEASAPTTNLNIVKSEDKFIIEFLPEGQVRIATEMFAVEELDISQSKTLMSAVMLMSELCENTDLREEIIVGTGLTAEIALQTYWKRVSQWRLNAALLDFIAKVHLPAEISTIPISKALKTKVISKESMQSMQDQSQWFFYPKADSPIASLVKDEVYFWLSTSHSVEEDVTNWYTLVVFHMQLIEKLIDYDAVSEIFVSSMVTAASALMMCVLDKDYIDEFSNRFPSIGESNYSTTTEVQSFLENYLELIRVYQKWKTIKVIRKLNDVKLTSISQNIVREICHELKCETIFTKHSASFQTSETTGLGNEENMLQNESNDVLINSLKLMLSNAAFSVKNVLLCIFKTKEYRCKGHPEVLLDLIDFELDTPSSITKYLQDCVDLKHYRDYCPMVEKIRSCTVSLLELGTSPNESINGLLSLVSAMTHLTAFMICLNEDSRTNFQVFLNKFEFVKDLERMWRKCLAVGSQLAEEPLIIRLKALTMELTLLYFSGNVKNRKQVISILPIQAFYHEYPQYIRLVRELELLDAEGETAANLARQTFAYTKKSNHDRSIQAIKEILRSSKNSLKVVFALIDCFSELEQEILSLQQWEILLLVSRQLTIKAREKVLKFDKIDGWYSESPASIQKEAAILFIMASEMDSELFHKAQTVLEEKLTLINSSEHDLEMTFRYIKNAQDGHFILNEGIQKTETIFLMELLWEKDNDLLSLIFTGFNNEKRSILAVPFTELLSKLREKPQLQSYAPHIISNLIDYFNDLESNDAMSEEDEKVFQFLKDLPEPASESPPKLWQIPAPLPIIEVQLKDIEDNQPQDPLVAFAHSTLKAGRPIHRELLKVEISAQFEDTVKKDETSSQSDAAEPVTKETFDNLQKWFLSKNMKTDFLCACKIASSMIVPETFINEEKSLKEVVANLLNLAVLQDDDEITKEVIEIITIIIRKVEKVRDHLLDLLKERHYYLQVFGLFSELIEKRFELIEKMNEADDAQNIYQVFWVSDFKNNTDAILAFLSLFRYVCDGCNAPFQHFLREQDENYQNNINIVELATTIMTQSLNPLCENLKRKYADAKSIEEKEKHGKDSKENDIAKLQFEFSKQESERVAEEVKLIRKDELVLNKCCRMLVEVLSGPCSENQKTVCAFPDFLDSVDSLVKGCAARGLISEELKTLMIDVLPVILALLEGRERNFQAIQEVMDEIDFNDFKDLALKQAIKLDEECISRINLKTSTPIEETQFKLTILSALVCFNTLKEDSLADFLENPIAMFISSVEIKVDEPESKIRFLSFPVPVICQFLESETAMKLILEIDRESREVKLDDFTSKVDICEIEMRHQQALAKYTVLTEIAKWWKYYWYCSFILVISINALFLLIVDNQDTLLREDEWWHYVLHGLGIAQVLFSCLGTASFYTKYAYTLKRSLKKREETTEMEKLPTLKCPGSSLRSFFTLRGNLASAQYDIDEVLKAIIRVGYSVAAVFAIWQPYLYPFLLFQIVNLNDSVVNILKSITMRGSQLILIFLFAIIVIYVFSFVAFFGLSSYFDPGNNLYCDSLFACFLSTLNMGLRAGGGIGDAISAPSVDDYNFRVFYDLLFYIGITTILMAIVFGLIVDTFSELRDEKNETEHDMNNVCFVCGHSRSMIELKGEGWKTHTLFVHNPFAYLYFLIYVKEKDVLDCSGIEKMVKEKLEKKDISFYPASSIELANNGVEEGQD